MPFSAIWGVKDAEPYKYLKFLQKWQKANNGISIIVKRKNLYKDLLNAENSTGQRFSSIPAFTKNDDGSVGMLRRQCTNEYKIQVVDDAIRDLYGLKPNQRRPATEVWHGITLDEMERMSIPDSAWKINTYPFIGYAASKKNQGYKIDICEQKTRADAMAWYVKNNLPIPPKSSCVFCPFQSDKKWYDMKINEPKDFAAAVKIDKAIRNSSKKGTNNPIYLSRSCKPLDQVKFNPNNEFEWGECSGNCNV